MPKIDWDVSIQLKRFAMLTFAWWNSDSFGKNFPMYSKIVQFKWKDGRGGFKGVWDLWSWIPFQKHFRKRFNPKEEEVWCIFSGWVGQFRDASSQQLTLTLIQILFKGMNLPLEIEKGEECRQHLKTSKKDWWTASFVQFQTLQHHMQGKAQSFNLTWCAGCGKELPD